MVLKPGQLINQRYRIIEQIGVGGMAIVYKANDEMLERDVTFKVLKEAYINDEDFIIRFSTEARAAARLSNTNIVNVYDVGNEGNINYIVMEYIDGFTLKDLICSKAPFTDEEAAGIAIQIAVALGHAHSHDIIHRDIKPENILITNVGGNGTVKVTDFGIAQAATSPTAPTDYMGSVHYFSPEQAKGEKADARSDIYSLGIVMYEMVTGKQPFIGNTPISLAMQHIKEPLPDIRKINPDISDALLSIIKKCTAKEPKNRYQNADALIRDLRAAIGFTQSVVSTNTDNITPANDDELSKTRKYNGKNSKEIISDFYNNGNNNDEDDEKEEIKREKHIITAAVIAGVILVFLMGIGGFMIMNSINTVPDFVGMTYDEAAAKAEKKGITVEFEQVYKEDANTGEVVEQSVEAGSKIKEDKDFVVVLSINVGENAILVPDIIDMTKSKAEDKLRENSLTLGDVKYVHSDKPVGTVLSQDPEAGNLVAVNSSINIEVSQGEIEEEVTMPDLINNTKEDAQAALEELGLIPKFIDGYSDTVEEGRIIDQGVKPDTNIGVGSSITLTVSKGKSDESASTTEVLTAKPPVIDIIEETSQTVPTSSIDGPIKRNVSIAVNPDFNNNNYGTTDGSDVYNVKVIAKDLSEERVLVDQKYSVADFPFSVTDVITDSTEYEVYINDTLLSKESK